MSGHAEGAHLEAKQIRACVNRILQMEQAYPHLWADVMREVGYRPINDLDAEALFHDEVKLEDASEDDIERLSKISIKAMEKGMGGHTPNAQMVRAFHAWLETREGEKQLAGVEIEVAPAEIPDKLSPLILAAMRELTEIANR